MWFSHPLRVHWSLFTPPPPQGPQQNLCGLSSIEMAEAWVWIHGDLHFGYYSEAIWCQSSRVLRSAGVLGTLNHIGKTRRWMTRERRLCKLLRCKYSHNVMSMSEVCGVRKRYTQAPFHTDAFTQRPFYAQMLLHTEAFTRRSLYTQAPLHTNAFTHRCLYTQAPLHTDTFTHRRFYTQTFLHTNSFTQRPFHTKTLLHTDAFTHRRFSAQTLLHTEALTH